MYDVGDPIAKRVFKEEIAKRLASGYLNTVRYLLEEDYIFYLSRTELESVMDDPNSKLLVTLLNLMQKDHPLIRSDAFRLINILGKKSVMYLKDKIATFIEKLNVGEILRLFRDIESYFSVNELKALFQANSMLIADVILMKLMEFFKDKPRDEDKIGDLFELIVYACSYLLNTEFRIIETHIFTSMLIQYYAEIDCSIWLNMKEDVYAYYVIPKDMFYYYDKIVPQTCCLNNEYLMYDEFGNIFFPNENVIVTKLHRSFDNDEPVVFRVLTYDGCCQNVKHFNNKIVPILENLGEHNISYLGSYLSEISSKKMDVKEKIFILYRLILRIYIMYYIGETRVISSKIFTSKLKEYYDKKNCTVDFEIENENVIKTFKVQVRGKPYYYDKNDVFDWLGMEYEAFNELKKIFFPDEDISVYEVEHFNFKTAPFQLKVRKELPI